MKLFRNVILAKPVRSRKIIKKIRSMRPDKINRNFFIVSDKYQIKMGAISRKVIKAPLVLVRKTAI